MKPVLSIHAQYRDTLRSSLWIVSVLAALMLCAWMIPTPESAKGIAGYTPLHTLLETVAIVIAMLVFGICWGAHDRHRPGNLILIACIFLGVGLFDFLHTLSYSGMPEFLSPSGPEKAINFWLMARSLSVFGLLLLAVLPWRPLPAPSLRWLWLAGILLLVALGAWVGLLHQDWLPRTFIPGQGLTPLKVATEYVLIGLLLLAAFAFLRNMRTPQPYDVVSLFTACLIMAMSEFFFTLYANVTDLFNLLGHIYKIFAYAYIYRSLFIDTVKRPFQQLSDTNQQLNRQIAERLRAESERQRSELGFRELLEHSPMPIAINTQDGQITFLNRRFIETFGYTLDDIPDLASWWPRAYPDPDYRTQAGQRWQAAVDEARRRQGPMLPVEYRIRCKDGAERTAEVHAAFIGDTIIVILNDLTERIRVDSELRKTADDLAKAQAIAHLGSWRIDLATNHLEWSEETRRIFCPPPGTTLDYEFFLHCIHPEDIEDVHAAWQHALTGEPYDVEHRIQVSGTTKWVRERAELIFDDARQPVAAIGSVQDITELKLATEALRDSEERWKFALEGAGDGVWDWHVETGILKLSRGWKAMLGHSDEEVGGELKEWEQRVHPEDKPQVMAVLQEALDGTRDYATEYRMRCKDGSWKWVLDRGMVVRRDAAGKPLRMIGTIADITQRKHMEAALREANEDLERRVLERTQQLAAAQEAAINASHAKSEFLANMSHEIRTPMNSILGMAHLALQTSLTGQQRDYLGKIQQSAQGLLDIINGILDISKIEAGKLQLEQTDFSLADLVARLSSQLGVVAANKGLQIDFDMAGIADTPLRGDPTRLSQIFTNLIGNAIKFTAHGHIAIRGRPLSSDAAGHLLRFEVADSGIGIAADRVAHIFDMFQQADSTTTRRYGGTGLGLTICRQLVTMMGGEIGVDSTPGQGSTFWFTVQLAAGQPPTARAEAPQQTVNLGALQGARILLVEDNPLNQQVAQEMLVQAGAQVSIANHGEEGVEQLLRQPFDCVLMDVQMPVMDGYEATRLIRANPMLAAMKVIAMTANARHEDRAMCLAAGMDDFISKPIDPDQLYATLCKWLDRSPPAAATGGSPVQPAPADAAQDSARPVDFSELSRLLGDNTDKLRKYALMFAESLENDLPRLEAALAEGDLAALGRHGHRIKSSARTVGALAFAELCEALEHVKDDGGLERARTLVAQMHAQLADILAQIRREFP